jgi:hypothetical protein
MKVLKVKATVKLLTVHVEISNSRLEIQLSTGWGEEKYLDGFTLGFDLMWKGKHMLH